MNKSDIQSLRRKNFDVVVVGAGHAGCEAAHAAAKMGASTLLVSMNPTTPAPLPCNPSIGGPGKGHLVREIDALGGIMAKVADASAIQMKELNTSKGPAVRAYRAQIDKPTYNRVMWQTLSETPNLTILDDEVKEIMAKNKRVSGIKTAKSGIISANSVVVCGGTFLNGEILIGNRVVRKGGRIDAKAANGLTESLLAYGIKHGRLKTGTPPRIARDSIDYSKMTVAPGSDGDISFSHPNRNLFESTEQEPCYLTYTTPATHKLILEHIKRSPVFSGLITERSPRSCPSIELKVANFPEKSRHPIFVEPIGRPSGPEGDRMYLQGCSTAFDEQMQERLVRSIPGLEQSRFLVHGYAVVYDYFLPHQLKLSLETKLLGGLFFAGQMNGTTGYEEAAAQGLIAGINAALLVAHKPSFILERYESYIGVLIEDLVTKIHVEPYRIFTSRAEYRLLLRNDNADLRLSKYAHALGLINDSEYRRVIKKQDQVKKLSDQLKTTKIKVDGKTMTLQEYLTRPEVQILDLSAYLPPNLSSDLAYQVELDTKYRGYFEKQQRTIDQVKNRMHHAIAATIDYDHIKGLRNEARIRLKEVQPVTVAQASRIQGVTPADLSLVVVANHSAAKRQELAG